MTTRNFENNFTTVEQSKRLLELGVPADSADCYYLREHPERIYVARESISKIRLRLHSTHAMPCWSAGQLLKICFICGGEKFIKDSTSMLRSFTGTSLSRRIDEMTETIVRFMEDRDDIFDFTQLNN